MPCLVRSVSAELSDFGVQFATSEDGWQDVEMLEKTSIFQQQQRDFTHTLNLINMMFVLAFNLLK